MDVFGSRICCQLCWRVYSVFLLLPNGHCSACCGGRVLRKISAAPTLWGPLMHHHKCVCMLPGLGFRVLLALLDCVVIALVNGQLKLSSC